MSEILRIKLELGTWLSRGFILVTTTITTPLFLSRWKCLRSKLRFFPLKINAFPKRILVSDSEISKWLSRVRPVNLFPRDRWRNVGDDVRGGFLLVEENAKRKEKVKNGRSNGNLGQLYLYRSNTRVNIARSRILGYSSEPTSENPS